MVMYLTNNGICFRLNCMLPQFIHQSPNPSVMIFRDEASRKPGEEEIHVHSDFNPFYLGVGGSGKYPRTITCDYH